MLRAPMDPGSSRFWRVEVSELSGAQRTFLVRSDAEPVAAAVEQMLVSLATLIDVGGQPVYTSRLALKTIRLAEEPAAAGAPRELLRYYVRGDAID